MRARACAAMLLAAATSRAACPSQGGPWPASFSYAVTDGRHVAVASALVPFAVDVVTPLTEAVEEDPTWPDAGNPQTPVSLHPLLADEHLKESALDITAMPDAECPGSTRVTSTYRWRFGTMAGLFGGEAKNMPALVVLATRDEVLARVIARASPEGAGSRTVPADLDLADDLAPALMARLKAMTATPDVEVADLLAILFDIQRAGTAITGFRRTPSDAAASKPESLATTGARDIGYSLSLTKAGESVSLSFGFSMPK